MMGKYLEQLDLVILEFSEELEKILGTRGKTYLNDGKRRILALQPAVQAKLKKMNVPYVNTFHLFGSQGHRNALLASSRIVSVLRKELSIEDNFGLTQGYINLLIFYFRLFLHDLLFLIEVVFQGIHSLEPHKVVAFEQMVAGPTKKSISKRERYLGMIVKALCLENDVDCELFSVEITEAAPDKAFHLSLGTESKFFKACFFLNLLLYRLFFKNKKKIICISKAYNMPQFVNSFKTAHREIVPVYIQSENWKKDILRNLSGESFFSFLVLPKSLSKKRRNQFAANLVKNMERFEELCTEHSQLFAYRGIDISELCLEFVRESILPSLEEMNAQTTYVADILKKDRPAICLAQQAVGFAYNVGELCRFYAVPGILISHGSHVPTKDPLARIEWLENGKGLIDTHYEFAAAQTPYARDDLVENSKRSEILNTGPLIFAAKHKSTMGKTALRSQLLPEVKQPTIILHAGTPKGPGSRRFHVYETLDEYIKNINDLIETVDNLNDIYLVVRFRPNADLSEKELLDLLVTSNNYEIRTDGRFEDFLSLADLLVSYSSTTIEEALQNRIPVLQYDSQGKYCHIPCQRLIPNVSPEVDSCFYIDEKDNLSWGLSWIVKNIVHGSALSEEAWLRHQFDPQEVCNISEKFREHFENVSVG